MPEPEENSASFAAHTLVLDGRFLNRGFWVYVVDVQAPAFRFLYVGRTGDSSSPYAASLFSRLSRHLDPRSSAKGNALLRHITKLGIDPSLCAMDVIGIGPIFSERADFDDHCVVRDKVAALEHGLALALRHRGYSVIGTHSGPAPVEERLLNSIVAMVESKLKRA